ncbi:MAG TPA: hypothetical protein VF115_13270 [Acidimicrobiia bacterium]
MSDQRTIQEKIAIAVAAGASAWVIGAAFFYESGDINPAGVPPTVACLIALWGAIKSDITRMWIGTALAIIFSFAFLFSVGFVVAPAAIALAIGSLVLWDVRHQL